MAQQYSDYEVIVSDNCSTDDTRDVVEEYVRPGLSYVKTPRPMTMSDHWEWALDHAKGEFVTFLCDDDAVSPLLLTRVAEVIRWKNPSVVALKAGLYVYDTWHDNGKRNSLVAQPFSGEALKCNGKLVLSEMFARLQYWDTPRANNAFFRKEVIHSIRKRAGRFCLPPAPDFSAACMVLATNDTYILLDQPLLLFGVSEESTGSCQYYRRGNASQQFLEECGAGMFRLSPIRTYCVTNLIAESFMRAIEAMPQEFRNLKVDLASQYICCREDLVRLAEHGVDVASELQELEAFRQGQGPAFWLGIASRTLRARVSRSQFGRPFRMIKQQVLGIKPGIPLSYGLPTVVMKGEEEGFVNIFECAQLLPKLSPRLCSATA